MEESDEGRMSCRMEFGVEGIVEETKTNTEGGRRRLSRNFRGEKQVD